jgi:hypothetical protein
MWGEFSILGIASAGVRIVLRITYEKGGMRGVGTLNVSIKICWCYTLHVNRTVQKQFSGSSTTKSRALGSIPSSATTANNGIRALGRAASLSKPDENGTITAADYSSLTEPKTAEAVKRYFDTLAI